MDSHLLTVGLAQLATECELAENRDKIIGFIRQAKERGCRVVVFPEASLGFPPATTKAEIDAAVAAIQAAAVTNAIYVVLGLHYRRTDDEDPYNRMLVWDPAGRLIYDYDKLWADTRFARVPGIFVIDGIPCNGAICGDRWIRAVEELPVFDGSRIIFEISNNYDFEWVPELGWYWYVPRAVRTGAYVVFVNAARDRPGPMARGHGPGHGHSAVVAPDGKLIVTAGEESDRLLVATLDLSRATALEAMRRRYHPLFKPFWDAGLTLLQGRPVAPPPFAPPVTPTIPITLAAAQITCRRDVGANLIRMIEATRSAREAGADLVAFPELALTGALEEDIVHLDAAALAAALDELRAVACEERIIIAFGTPSFTETGQRRNSAFVIGESGEVLTRYDQLVVDRRDLFEPGLSTHALWFQIKGVPAVVTIGSDAHWTEIAELAAVRGAQVHVHLDYDSDLSAGADLRRQQHWVNLATYFTFTATVNAASPAGVDRGSAAAHGGSIIWHDFRPTTNHRREIDGRTWFCAVRLAEAGSGDEVIIATQTVPAVNLAYQAMVEQTVPTMRPWYDIGARVIDSAVYAGEDA